MDVMLTHVPTGETELFLAGATLEGMQSHHFFKEDAHHDDGGSDETDPWPQSIWDDLTTKGHTSRADPDYIWSVAR